MGLLVGLPLKLLHIVFLLLRFAWPLLLAALIWWVVNRRKNGGAKRERPKGGKKSGEYDGPVVEVDYTVVDEEERK